MAFPAVSCRARLERSVYAKVWALARQLTAGKATTYDEVVAVERYLRLHYSYNEAPPDRPVPLRDFLFRDREGYCRQFSGAMALMLRMVGIPSRVASGFTPGEREHAGDPFQVSDRDAHSWVEVYFNGIGWVPFEPTPSAAPAGPQLAQLESSRSGVGEGATVIPRRGLVRPQPLILGDLSADGGPGWLGTLLLGALLAALAAAMLAVIVTTAFTVVRGLRSRELGPVALAEAQARELEAALPRLGFPIPAGATLLDLEARHSGRAALVRYLRALRLCRYRPERQPPGSSERRAMRRQLSDGRGIGGRLRALRAIPPLYPDPREGPR